MARMDHLLTYENLANSKCPIRNGTISDRAIFKVKGAEGKFFAPLSSTTSINS
jgi:hypothetical protein